MKSKPKTNKAPLPHKKIHIVSSDELMFVLEYDDPIPLIVARFKKLAAARLKEEIIARNNCKTLAEYRERNKWHYPSTEEEADVSFWPNEFSHAKGLPPIIDMLRNAYYATDAVTANLESRDIEKTAHSVFLFTSYAMQAGLFVDYLKEIELEEQGIKIEKQQNTIKKMRPDAERGKKVKQGAAAGGLERNEAAEENSQWYRGRAEQKIKERKTRSLQPLNISELSRLLEAEAKRSDDVIPRSHRQIRRIIAPLFNHE